MKIETGNFEVYESGSVITANNQPIDFSFSNLTFRFVFKDEPGSPMLRVNAEKLEPNVLVISFINYNESLGAGNKELLKLGQIGGRDLYLNYRIYSLQHGFDKLIHYTWYLIKK